MKRTFQRVIKQEGMIRNSHVISYTFGKESYEAWSKTKPNLT